MTVLYTATALAEIEEICSYIAKDNQRAAASVAAAIERAVAAIAKRPQSAPVVFEGKIRAKLSEDTNIASSTKSSAPISSSETSAARGVCAPGNRQTISDAGLPWRLVPPDHLVSHRTFQAICMQTLLRR